MKKIIVFCLFQICFLSAFTQFNRTRIVGKIYYNTTHIWDTVTGRTMNEVSILYFGATESLFRSFDYLQAMYATKKMEESGKTTFGSVMGRGTSDCYYTNLQKKELARVKAFGVSSSAFSKPNYIMPEPIDRVNWTIVNETKKIGDYTCQKATGVCRGRLYNAWFCADIPYTFGPWKLSGLPGLIMEAEDDRLQVIFRFNRIELPISTEEYIEPVTNSILVKESDFEKMREAPVSAVKAPGNMTGSITLTDANGKPVQPKPAQSMLISNPMDLISKLPRLGFQ